MIMSRTYRQLKGDPYWKRWALDYELIRVSDYKFFCWIIRRVDKNTKEYKKALAKFHSDAGVVTFKEPGPSWFRNLYSERPQRRKAKRELKKFMLDNEYEVILNNKEPLQYWT